VAHLEGFEAFYAASYQRVVGRVYALLGDLAEAEDVTQDAFAKASFHWSRIAASGKLTPSVVLASDPNKVSRVEVNLLDFDASGRFLIYKGGNW
jgi:Sigma-70 region 2